MTANPKSPEIVAAIPAGEKWFDHPVERSTWKWRNSFTKLLWWSGLARSLPTYQQSSFRNMAYLTSTWW
jgi:hypothetical protein